MAKLEKRELDPCGIPLDAEYFDVSGIVGRPRLSRTRVTPTPADGRAPGSDPAQTGFEESEEYFDPFEGIVPAEGPPLPRCGESQLLASFQLHPQYCGVLTCFAQFTDLYARDCSQVLTPGFEWLILQNGKPIFPYTRTELIVNPWGYNNYPVGIRLDENARLEFRIHNRSVADSHLERYPIQVFAGRLTGRYWYSRAYGRRLS